MWQPKYCNCLLWAIYAWTTGLGAFRVRRALAWEGGSHFYIQTPEGLELAYEPLDKNTVSFLRGALEVFFRGEVTCRYLL